MTTSGKLTVFSIIIIHRFFFLIYSFSSCLVSFHWSPVLSQPPVTLLLTWMLVQLFFTKMNIYTKSYFLTNIYWNVYFFKLIIWRQCYCCCCCWWWWCYCFYCLAAKSCLTLCDPMDCSTPGFSVPHHLQEFAQVHVHWFSVSIQPSHPLLLSSPSAFNPSQYQGLFQWVSCLHQVAKVLEFQHQSFKRVFRVDLL